MLAEALPDPSALSPPSHHPPLCDPDLRSPCRSKPQFRYRISLRARPTEHSPCLLTLSPLHSHPSHATIHGHPTRVTSRAFPLAVVLKCGARDNNLPFATDCGQSFHNHPAIAPGQLCLRCLLVVAVILLRTLASLNQAPSELRSDLPTARS